MLLESEELPEPTDCFQSNALWSMLAQRLNYKLLFAKQKSGLRHINVDELRAGLKTEKILGHRRPSSRVLLGMDSQVARGSLVKGRSSSAALNAELARSIPLMLLQDTYFEGMYFNTAVPQGEKRSNPLLRHSLNGGTP